jgi:aspartate ammonia-lyase
MMVSPSRLNLPWKKDGDQRNAAVLAVQCVDKFVGESLMLVTALSPIIGYDKASAIAHRALDQNTTLREAALSGGFIGAKEFDKAMDPKKMVGNPRRDLGTLNSDSHPQSS